MAEPAGRRRAIDLAHGVAGKYLWRPWFDRLALAAVVAGYSPLSRIWATALEVGDPEALRTALPELAKGQMLAGAWRGVHRRAAAYVTVEAEWQTAFFGTVEGADLPGLHRRRMALAQRHMLGRIAFTAVPGWWKVPAVRYEIPDAATVLAAHGARLAATDPFPPVTGTITRSRAIETRDHRLYWLNFASSAGDTAWARVMEPLVPNPPTFISLHGLAVEQEMSAGAPDPYAALVRAGIRVIHAEAPFHGRRRLPGWGAGEPAIGRAPLGMLDLLQHWTGEVAALIGWARAQGSARVGLGGTSLGALTSQRAAVASRHWPAALRPDALLLVTTSGDMLDITLRGGLARGLKLDRALAEGGWAADTLAPWRALLEPGAEVPLAPDRILMVLGEADVVTPFAGGQSLAAAWGLPDANLYLRPRGHFSQAIAMLGDTAPLAALTRLLQAGV